MLFSHSLPLFAKMSALSDMSKLIRELPKNNDALAERLEHIIEMYNGERDDDSSLLRDWRQKSSSDQSPPHLKKQIKRIFNQLIDTVQVT